MATVNLVPDVTELHGGMVQRARWAGSQGWVGNLIYCPLSLNTGGRPIRHVQAHLKATNTTIPGAASSSIKLQHKVNGKWFDFARVMSHNAAAVASGVPDLAWIRNTCNPGASGSYGALLLFLPWYEAGGGSAADRPPLICDEIRLVLDGNALDISGSGTEWLWTSISLDVVFGV